MLNSHFYEITIQKEKSPARDEFVCLWRWRECETDNSMYMRKRFHSKINTLIEFSLKIVEGRRTYFTQISMTRREQILNYYFVSVCQKYSLFYCCIIIASSTSNKVALGKAFKDFTWIAHSIQLVLATIFRSRRCGANPCCTLSIYKGVVRARDVTARNVNYSAQILGISRQNVFLEKYSPAGDNTYFS